MRDGYWIFKTYEEASAFFQGVDYVNDSELSPHSPAQNPNTKMWEVKVTDYEKDECPYCGVAECDFNGTHACDGSANDIDGLEGYWKSISIHKVGKT